MNYSRRQLLISGSAMLAIPSAVMAQSKPVIRILVGFPPGGATDAIARVVADKLPGILGQPVIIENKPGVGGRIAADTALNATPDGLTYMIAPNATPTFQMLVFGKVLKWDILKDFTAVAGIASYPLGMGVSLETGASNVKEFVEWVKRNPEKGNFGTPGTGGQNHFLGVQFAKAAGIELQLTPYKGTPPMVADLAGGHVPAAISVLDSMLPQHKAGKIKVIGVFTKERSPLMPDVPTFAEQGIDVTSGEAWTGMWAKAGTPAAEVSRMQAAVHQALQMTDVREHLSQHLFVQPNFRTGTEIEALERAELAHWAPIIKASGFKPE